MSDISIVTSTFYNLDIESQRLRANIAKQTISKILEKGYEIIIPDPGST